MLPTVTAPTAPPPLPPVPGPVGVLLPPPEHPTAAATAPVSIQVRMIRMLPPRSKGRAVRQSAACPYQGDVRTLSVITDLVKTSVVTDVRASLARSILH